MIWVAGFFPMKDSVDVTRERLLVTAGQVFAERGYRAATIRQICTRAGANIAAVHYYFGDKERLYIEAVKYAHACVMNPEEFQPTWPAGTPAAQRLSDFIHSFVARLLDPGRPPWHARLLMHELAQPTAACAELVRDNIRPVADRFMEILEDVLPAGTPRVERYLHGFSIIGQCIMYCQNKPILRLLMGEEAFDGLGPETIADHVTRFTLAALGLGVEGTQPQGASR